MRHSKYISLLLVFVLVLGTLPFNAFAIGYYDAMKDRYSVYELDLQCLDNYVILHFFDSEPYAVFTDLELCTNTPIQNTYDRMEEQLTGDETPEEVYPIFEKAVYNEVLKRGLNAAQVELFVSYTPKALTELGVDVEALEEYAGKTKIFEEVAKNVYQDIDSLAKAIIKTCGDDLKKSDIFTDISDVEWAREAIEYFASQGILTGDSDNLFNPDADMKREELAKFLSLAFELTEKADIAFSDVPEGSKYHDFVSKIIASGFMKGYGESFGVGDVLTRQDLAVICVRYLETENKIAQNSETLNFSDKDEISDYAKDSVNTLASMGIVNGMEDGSFAPLKPVTRAEATKIIYETIKFCKEVK